jgi:4'-phosphopantetheinyl transferase
MLQISLGHSEIISRELHIWKIKFSEWGQPVGALSSLLSVDEQARAQRYHLLRDQQRYILRRSLLRKILSRYLRIPAHQIRLQYNQYGKPILCGSSLRFNLSCSRDLMLIAIAENVDVGIDVEYINHDSAYQGIAGKFFSKKEVDSLARLPAVDRVLGFFLCWTRKEAFIKAKGEGLTYPLHQFEVSVDPNDPPQLLYTALDPQEAQHWKLINLNPAEHYAATVAVNAPIDRVLNLFF